MQAPSMKVVKCACLQLFDHADLLPGLHAVTLAAGTAI